MSRQIKVFNDLPTIFYTEVNFLENLSSEDTWNTIPLNLTPKRKMKMKQAVKSVEVVKNALVNNTEASAVSSKTDKVSTKKTVVQLERNVSLSRYLEACGDCV